MWTSSVRGSACRSGSTRRPAAEVGPVVGGGPTAEVGPAAGEEKAAGAVRRTSVVRGAGPAAADRKARWPMRCGGPDWADFTPRPAVWHNGRVACVGRAIAPRPTMRVRPGDTRTDWEYEPVELRPPGSSAHATAHKDGSTMNTLDSFDSKSLRDDI